MAECEKCGHEKETKSMMLCFTLTMPGVNSWNGQWTGQEKFYAIVENLGRSQKAMVRGKALLDVGSWRYNFGDGWSACVTAKQVTTAEAQKARTRSDGFCGYDWMVRSILDNGEIKVK